MSLGFKPYLVALASLLAGASVVHAVFKPDLVSEWRKREDGEEARTEKSAKRMLVSRLVSFFFSTLDLFTFPKTKQQAIPLSTPAPAAAPGGGGSTEGGDLR